MPNADKEGEHVISSDAELVLALRSAELFHVQRLVCAGVLVGVMGASVGDVCRGASGGDVCRSASDGAIIVSAPGCRRVRVSTKCRMKHPCAARGVTKAIIARVAPA